MGWLACLLVCCFPSASPTPRRTRDEHFWFKTAASLGGFGEVFAPLCRLWTPWVRGWLSKTTTSSGIICALLWPVCVLCPRRPIPPPFPFPPP